MQDTKLTFSDEELKAISDNRFFTVKHDATKKVMELLVALENELTKRIHDNAFPASGIGGLREKGKIYKGENYKLMPYILLDCPRKFDADSVFAFRSMFLWGNHFSFTLHLQGGALETFREQIRKNIFLLAGKNYFVCVHDTPWDYVFEKWNYENLDVLISGGEAELDRIIGTHPFIKISRKLSLEKYDAVVSYGLETFNELMNVLG